MLRSDLSADRRLQEEQSALRRVEVRLIKDEKTERATLRKAAQFCQIIEKYALSTYLPRF